MGVHHRDKAEVLSWDQEAAVSLWTRSAQGPTWARDPNMEAVHDLETGIGAPLIKSPRPPFLHVKGLRRLFPAGTQAQSL